MWIWVHTGKIIIPDFNNGKTDVKTDVGWLKLARRRRWRRRVTVTATTSCIAE